MGRTRGESERETEEEEVWSETSDRGRERGSIESPLQRVSAGVARWNHAAARGLFSVYICRSITLDPVGCRPLSRRVRCSGAQPAARGMNLGRPLLSPSLSLSLSVSLCVEYAPGTLVLPKSTGNSHPRQDATFRVEWLDSTNVEQWLRFYYRCGGWIVGFRIRNIAPTSLIEIRMFMDFANSRQAFTLILNVVPKELVILSRTRGCNDWIV